MGVNGVVFFFFFKQKTAYEMCGRDWSSDVCSSDLEMYVSNLIGWIYRVTHTGKHALVHDTISAEQHRIHVHDETRSRQFQYVARDQFLRYQGHCLP